MTLDDDLELVYFSKENAKLNPKMKKILLVYLIKTPNLNDPQEVKKPESQIFV